MEQQEQSHARMSFAEREQFRASLKVRLVTLELMPSLNRRSSESRGQACLDYAESRQRKTKLIFWIA